MTSIHIKGTPVNGLLDFVRSELTPEQLEGVIAGLPEREQPFWKAHVLAHDLVPLEAANRLTEAAAAAKGEPLKSFAMRAGRFGAEMGLKTVYKFVLMVMSVEGVLKKAPFMWTRVYDGGKLGVQSSENTATITVAEFPSNPAVCGRIMDWFQVIGERSGAKNVRLSHRPCVTEGAPGASGTSSGTDVTIATFGLENHENGEHHAAAPTVLLRLNRIQEPPGRHIVLSSGQRRRRAIDPIATRCATRGFPFRNPQSAIRNLRRIPLWHPRGLR